MTQLPKILLTFLVILFVNKTYGQQSIRLVVKTIDDATVFVFYHSREQTINITVQENLVNAKLRMPATLEIIDYADVLKYANFPKLSQDQRSITFNTKGEFIAHTIINGEKLTAIKFKDKQPITISTQTKSTKTNQERLGAKSNQVIALNYKNHQDQHILSCSFAEQNVGMSAFFKDKYLWIIFDKHRKFTFSSNEIFNNFTQLDNKTGSILRLQVPREYNQGKVSKKNNTWNIIITKGHLSPGNKRQVINFTALESGKGAVINGNFNNNVVLDTYDPTTNQLLKVNPLKIPGARTKDTYQTTDLQIIPSLQGVAIAINSDDIQWVKNKDSLEIINKHTTFVTHDWSSDNSNTQQFTNIVKQKSMLPIRNSEAAAIGFNDGFNDNYSTLVRKISQAENKDDMFTQRLMLAKLLFMHALYHESLATLLLTQKTTPHEYRTSLEAQFLTAVNLTLVGNVIAAKDIYSNLRQNLVARVPEIELWNNYNEFLASNNKNTIGFLSNLNNLISNYPDNLYWVLAFSEIETYLSNNNLEELAVMFKRLQTPTGKAANSLKFYKANYYKKNAQFALAKQLMQELTLTTDDPFNQVRAAMELVQFKLNDQEITKSEATKQLNNLRFMWRGDKLEYDLLMLIVTYYRDLKDSINTLRTYKYVQTAFSNNVNNFYITTEMVKIFNSIFLPQGTAKALDAFTAVALFYEFKELNPVGTEGDEVILLIARLLIKLDLLDNATNLLKHQINYRLKGERRVINANHLAIILLLDKKPSEAIWVLDQTDKDNFKFNEHQYRLRLKAKALIDLKKYLEALSCLKNDYSSDAQILKKEALFRAGKWQEYIALQEVELTSIADMTIDDVATQNIARLAIAYHMQNKQQALHNLFKNLNSKNSALKNTVELLLISNTPVDYRNLDKSLNINQMQILLDKYKNQTFKLQ